jgi:hypothetical protein
VQERDRVGERQQVQVEAPGAVAGDQPGERVTAGYHHVALGMAGQQRPHLLHRGGVVQHDQHLPAGEEAAETGGAVGLVGRDVLTRHTQGAQEPGQRVGGGRGLVGVVAAQVHMQLPVPEPGSDLVRPVQRQSGLAHPRGPADRRDHHRAGRAGRSLIQHPGQRPQLGGPAGEFSHRCGQLPRHRCRPTLWAGGGAVGGQQLLDAVSRNPYRLSQLGPQPRQRLCLATFPAHHRGALHAQLLGQLFLGQAHCLAALCETPPLPCPRFWGTFRHSQHSAIRNGRWLTFQHTPGCH